MKNKPLSGQLKIILGIILFSFIPIIVRYGKGISLFHLSFARVFITTAVLFIIILIKDPSLLKRNQKGYGLLIFGILHALTILASFYAIQKFSIAIATVFLFAGNIYLFIFSIFVFKEKPDKSSFIALSLAVIGFILIFSRETIKLNNSLIDYGIAISSGILMAIIYALGKHLRSGYDEKTLTFYQNLVASLILLPSVIMSPLELSPHNSIVYLALGIFCTAIPFVLIYNGLKDLPAKKVSVLLTLNIPIPIILAMIFFKEIPSLTSGLGIFLMIMSIWLIYPKKSANK